MASHQLSKGITQHPSPRALGEMTRGYPQMGNSTRWTVKNSLKLVRAQEELTPSLWRS